MFLGHIHEKMFFAYVHGTNHLSGEAGFAGHGIDDVDWLDALSFTEVDP